MCSFKFLVGNLPRCTRFTGGCWSLSGRIIWDLWTLAVILSGNVLGMETSWSMDRYGFAAMCPRSLISWHDKDSTYAETAILGSLPQTCTISADKPVHWVMGTLLCPKQSARPLGQSSAGEPPKRTFPENGRAKPLHRLFWIRNSETVLSALRRP